MKKIFKYEIDGYETEIQIHGYGKIVHVGKDPNGVICAWAEVNPDDKLNGVWVYVIGTGHQIPHGTGHVGTFNDGPFMWHVYTR